MFHFPKDKNTNPTFQTVKRWRLKQDYCYLYNLVKQHGTHLDKLTQKGLALKMATFYAVNPKPKKAIRPAKSQRDRDIQHKAVHLGMTTGELADEYGLSPTTIRKVLEKDCECIGRGRGARWVYADKRRRRRAKRELTEHRKAYRRKNIPQCPCVQLPEGRIHKTTMRYILNSPLIFVLWRRKGHKPKRCTVGVASVASGAVRTSARGMGRQIGTPLTRAMQSVFLDHKVRADLVNGYPAFVWKNGMHVFFHEFNWLRAHNLWAKPWRRETMHIHHVNGDKLDCRPKNLVLFTGREHDALHSRKRHGKG